MLERPVQKVNVPAVWYNRLPGAQSLRIASNDNVVVLASPGATVKPGNLMVGMIMVERSTIDHLKPAGRKVQWLRSVRA
jgi:hypothetical protein